MIAQITCVLVALLLGAQRPAATELEAQFAAAERDPARVVGLIVEVSALLSQVDADTGQQLADRLEPFCKRAFFGPERFAGMEQLGLALARVEQGELPGRIASRRRIGAGLLGHLNARYDAARVAAGTELKVLDLSDDSLRLIVDKTRKRLAAWRATKDGAWVLVMYAPIGIGAPESPTPEGTTTITSRVRNPEWTHPVTKKVLAPNDPENVLGGYWMRLDEAGLGRSGIGLHGYTGAPAADWLARGGSNGCIRLLQVDIDRLFELALEGTRVTIVK